LALRTRLEEVLAEIPTEEEVSSRMALDNKGLEAEVSKGVALAAKVMETRKDGSWQGTDKMEASWGGTKMAVKVMVVVKYLETREDVSWLGTEEMEVSWGVIADID